MLRYFIRISFLGNNYCGWQTQPGQISVQGTIEKCISNLTKNKINKIYIEKPFSHSLKKIDEISKFVEANKIRC